MPEPYLTNPVRTAFRRHLVSLNQFYGCGTHVRAWDDEGLAEAHDELDGREEDEAEERLLTRLGMSKYYGSEGFDRPPSDVYSYGGGYFGDDGAGA